MKMRNIPSTGSDIFLSMTYGNDSRSSMNITENSGVSDLGQFDIDLENIDFLETHDAVVPDTLYLGAEQFLFASKTDPYMGIKKRMPISVDDAESICSQFSESERSESENTTPSANSIKRRLAKTVLKRCRAEGKVLFHPEKDKVEIMPTKEEEAKELERRERNKLSAKKSRDSKKAAEIELKKDNEKLLSENSSLKAAVKELEEKLRKCQLLERELAQFNIEPRIQQEKNDDGFMVTGRRIEQVFNNIPSFDALVDSYSIPEDKPGEPDEEFINVLQQLLEGKSIQFLHQDSQPCQHPAPPPSKSYPPGAHLIITQDNSSESQLAISGSAYCQGITPQSVSIPDTLYLETRGMEDTFEQPAGSQTAPTENNGDVGDPQVERDDMANGLGDLSIGIRQAASSVSPPLTSYTNEEGLTQTASNRNPDTRSVKPVSKGPSPWIVAEENDDEMAAELRQYFIDNENKEPPEKKARQL
ncbi:unnamed protein product [Lymnaea stagnalis]|uniref:BZIP domain-containing protein n=1 Tax=Lymnaea stagnalis TaxID=6523 RepID=A0AAV2HSQ8_LYMST